MKTFTAVVAGFVALAAIRVMPAQAADAPTDAWVTTKAKISILTTVGVPGAAIHVDTSDGKVTLHGKVSSAADKEKAQKAAASVDGVKAVRNLLQVVPSLEKKAVETSDSAIEDKVKAALKNDPMLEGSSIEVQSVNKNTVLLAGRAESLSAELRAIETVEQVPGVNAVHSEIESPDAKADAEVWRKVGEKVESNADKSTSSRIKGGMSDAYITAAAKMRLLTSRDTPGMDINVDTTDGVVTLFGYVPSGASKAKAEAEAQKVSGVRRVQNELQIVPASQRPQVGRRDSEIEGTIQRAIASDEELSSANINVEVRNGVARLSGTVASESDKAAATTMARRANGVRDVESDLQIDAD